MFDTKCSDLFIALGESQIMVLASCANNRVTARSMSIIIKDKKLYFQTDKSFLKYQQIKENENIALCINNIQIEGICKEKGHPMDGANKAFIEQYKKYYQGSFDSYSHLQTETVFEVAPVLITTWNYEEGIPFREYYDFKHRTYVKAYYQ